MSDVVIFHNPRLRNSRNAPGPAAREGRRAEGGGISEGRLTRPQLETLLKTMGVSARDILRVRGTDAHALGLTDPTASDEALIAAMILSPILVERPIVVTPKGAALCRPFDRVLTLI